MIRSLVCLALAGWLFSAAAALAEKLPLATADGDDDRAAQISQLIEELDQPEFADRQDASQKLTELGKDAVEQLEQAVARGNREVSGRALDILKRHFESNDGEIKQAAKASLDRLASSNVAATAQRARNILYPRKDQLPAAAPPGFRGGFVPGIPGGNIGGFGGVVVRQVSMRTDGNGGRKIEIQENGQTTTLETQPGGRIKVTLPEKKDGRDVTRTIEADSLEDLRKKDPQAARIYEQNDRPPAVRVGALPNVRLAPNGNAVPMPVLPAAPPTPSSLKRTLESIDASIERYKARLPNDPGAQRAIDSLERTRRHFQELLPAEAPARS